MAADPTDTTVTTDTPEQQPETAAVATATVSVKKLSAEELIKGFEAEQLKSELPEIYVGDTVRVGVRISEGNK